MTVAATGNRIVYTGNGVAVAYTYPFRILAAADLLVYIDGVVKTLTTDYNVSGVDAAGGGTVTFVVAPANASQVLLIRATPLLQPVDLREHDSSSAETQEREYDRLTLLIQDLAEVVGRALPVAVTSALSSLVFPAPGAGLFIRWNAAGTALEAAAAGGGGGGGVAGVSSLGTLTGALVFVNDTNVVITPAGQNLTLGWNGLLSVARGGTGRNGFTQNGVLYGNFTGAIQVTPASAGPSGQVLFSSNGNAPNFTNTPGVDTIDVAQNVFISGGNGLGFLVFRNTAVTHFVRFQAAAAIPGDVTWTLPGTDGSNGQLLSTNGTGTLSWVTVAGGGISTLDGENGAVQTFSRVSDTNVTLTLTHAANDHAFTLGWTGTLAVARGGTGAGAFTQGSVIFAGASGVYTQDNANFFWDDTNNRLGIGTATPAAALQILATSAMVRSALEYSDAGTNSAQTALFIQHRSSVNMVDGFGVQLDLGIRDNAAADNVLARFIAVRAGADNTGQLSVQTAIAGALADRLVINSAGHLLFSGSTVFYLQATGLNAAAIQAAHDALPSSGGKIVLPAGTFTLSGTVNITKAVTLEGAGPASEFGNGTRLSGSSTAFAIATQSAVTVRGIGFDLSGAGVGISIAGSGGLENKGTIIDGCYFGAGATGISITAAIYFAIRNCYFLNQTTNCIAVSNTVDVDRNDSTILGCILNVSGSISALKWTSGGGLKIVDNKILVGGTGTCLDIQLSSGAAGDLVIVGNSMENGQYAILIQGANTLEGTVITGNQLGQQSVACIGINASGVRGVVITGNAIRSTAGRGVQLVAAANVIVEGNLFYNITGASIGIDASSAGCTACQIGVNSFQTVTTPISVADGGVQINSGGATFTNATLPGTAANGSMIYCSDCTFANPCAGGGGGAMAKRLSAAWRCD